MAEVDGSVLTVAGLVEIAESSFIQSPENIVNNWIDCRVVDHEAIRRHYEKEPGLMGSLRSFVARKYRDVKAVEEYIKAGDIFQVVPSQRFAAPTAADPFDIYRSLRVANPSPYLFFLKLGKTAIAGSSPEMLVKVEGRDAFYRPIAGTRWRGRDEAEDQRMAAEMLADPKERAEHIMLVDLGRNDLGRVSEYGSVKVEELMFVERFSQVMHLVSRLKGRLRPDVDCLDALMACFPAGTLSGAPKVRAMEIIRELEPTRRGVYSGAVLYLDFSGNLDSCIAIRTFVIQNGVAYFQAGCGVVADSVPRLEYLETLNKARALVAALEMAGHPGE